jgi:DNA-binding winged helix-turn-helix (wHTH) protein/predicted ATPase
VIRFAEFALDPESAQLLRAGAPVELQPKPYELLVLLTQAPGRLFTREQLDAALWPDVRVTEDSLSQAVRRLRAALGDEARSPRFVETVSRRGYRWIGALVTEQVVAPEPRPTLPRPEDAFVGRAAELDLLRGALERSRVVTVVGPGGIGKTRLALEVPEVAAWCRLGAAADEASLLAAVAEGLSLPPEAATPERIRAALRDSDDLVLLDEAEGAADLIAAAVADWFAAAPSARFLVTSRRRLGLAAERVVELGPLSARDGAALYVARAAAVEPGATDAEAEVLALVDALDGWPLAIELAAARRTVLDAAAVRVRLTDSLQVLEQPRADRPDRHRSLDATLAWSWSLLTEAQQVAAARLSAFVGGAALASAERVLDDQGDPLGLIEALRQRSWLQRSASLARFEQYAPLRRFAAARAEAMGIAADTRARFVAVTVQRVIETTSGPTAVLAAERANVWAAFSATEEPEAALALARGLVRIDMHAEPSFAPLFRALDRVIALAAARPAVRSGALVQRSRIRKRDDPDGALADARAAMVDAGEAPKPKASALRALALALPSGHPERFQALTEAVRLARQLGDIEAEAGALGNLGMLYRQLGRALEARDVLEQSVALCRRLGAAWLEARALIYLCGPSVFEQDLERVQRAALRAMEVLDPRHDAVMYGQCLEYLALIARYEERLDDAIALYLQDEALGRSAWLMTPGLPVRQRAEIAIERGDLAGARALLSEAGSIPSPLGRAERGYSDLMLLVAERRWDEAEDNTIWRAATYRDVGYRNGEAAACTWRALVAGARGDGGAAACADVALGLIEPSMGRIGESYTVMAEAAPLLAAIVAGDRSARPPLDRMLAQLVALAPVGPTTGAPAMAPDVRAASRMIAALAA